MVDFNSITALLPTSLTNGIASIKKGVLVVLSEGSRKMYEFYTVDGFEKGTKAFASNLKFAERVFSLNGRLNECIKTVEGQKDLIYATNIIRSLSEFVDVNEKTKEIGFHLPRLGGQRGVDGWKIGQIDSIKILYAFADFFETGKFLQRNQVFAFTSCVEFANRLGSVKVWNTTTVGQIPVLNSLCSTPKDIFIFMASMIDSWNRLILRPSWEFDNLLKVTSSVGKMLLISFGSTSYNKHLVFSIVDIATQNASLWSYFLKKEKDRTERANKYLTP